MKKFVVRTAVIVAAVVLIMYLAKVWFFVDEQRVSVPGVKSGQKESIHSEKPSSAEGEQVISWRDAAKYYGKYVTVEGKIVATHNSGKACFLNFHPDYKRHFTAVIFASAFSRFPPNPEDFYYQKKVRVSGYIKEYNGKPEITLGDPSQIEILP